MSLVPERSAAAELLDRPDNMESDLRRALADIGLVNRLLGGRDVLLRAIRPFLSSGAQDRALELLDVGTGGADLPLAVVRDARRLGRAVRVTAIDREPTIAAIAGRATQACDAVRVVQADACRLPFRPGSFDLVTVSMFLHHFEHERVVDLLRSFARLARRAVLVNDLRRHLVPYGFIYAMARLTGRSPMFVHDAPLSVLRGFTPGELRRAAVESGASRVWLRRRWPYRLLMTLPRDEQRA